MNEIKKVYGPYITTSDREFPRRFVVVVYVNGEKKTTSYARHTMEKHLGRQLSVTEEVDHINGDQLDDRIENLQVLTPQQNRAKGRSVEMVMIQCLLCGTLADKRARDVRANRKKGKAGPFCGKSCAGKWSTGKRP